MLTELFMLKDKLFRLGYFKFQKLMSDLISYLNGKDLNYKY